MNLYVIHLWPYGYGVRDAYVYAETPEQALQYWVAKTGETPESYTIEVLALVPGVISESRYIE